MSIKRVAANSVNTQMGTKKQKMKKEKIAELREDFLEDVVSEKRKEEQDSEEEENEVDAESVESSESDGDASDSEEDYMEDDDGEDGEIEGEESLDADVMGEQRKMDPDLARVKGFATAFRTIMERPVEDSSSQTTLALQNNETSINPVLADAPSVFDTIEERKEVARIQKQLVAEKKKIWNAAHVKPDILKRTQEKNLKKTATRGVVRLLNTIMEFRRKMVDTEAKKATKKLNADGTIKKQKPAQRDMKVKDYVTEVDVDAKKTFQDILKKQKKSVEENAEKSKKGDSKPKFIKDRDDKNDKKRSAGMKGDDADLPVVKKKKMKHVKEE